jgi:integration host factor subunit alpha
MSALSKADITQSISTELEMDKKDAKMILECFFDVIKEALANGEGVKLSGFGNFVIRDKGKRPGRNPKTGELVTVDARRVVTFKAGLKLKRRVTN